MRYDRIVVDESKHLSARDDEFSIALEKALDRNRQILSELVDELGAAGFTKRSDLPDLSQGYPSKFCISSPIFLMVLSELIRYFIIW